METKDFKFNLDDIDEEKGTFTGFASVFDVVDSYNEVVLPGAFKKTLKENDGKFPLTWFHDISQRGEFGIKSKGTFKSRCSIGQGEKKSYTTRGYLRYVYRIQNHAG